ncbi:unnamed protein product [Microthlaspi erraticum]|uniref:Uncharacterized protein n=1 Tax=Microthlaspi erraticum TaxID=1685480 RepID=A0A6D2KUA5_9BRAS|nr:unnamed protein product [Microthlaspi erraticum]
MHKSFKPLTRLHLLTNLPETETRTHHVPLLLIFSNLNQRCEPPFCDCDVFWSILEHMGHKEHGGTWHMEAAQLDTQRKKGEAILKTSSTGRVPQLDRPSFNSIELESKSNPKNVASPLTFL